MHGLLIIQAESIAIWIIIQAESIATWIIQAESIAID